jgi:hypothetical protein
METVQVPIDWKLSQPRDAYAEEVRKTNDRSNLIPINSVDGDDV